MTDDRDPIRAAVETVRDAHPTPDLAARIKAEARTRSQAADHRWIWRTGAAALIAASLIVAVALIALPLNRPSVMQPFPTVPPTTRPSTLAASVPPVSSPASGVQAGLIARATGEFSVGGAAVEVGQSVFIVAGPTDRDGVSSYLLQHFGDLDTGYRPDGSVGWVRADVVTRLLVPRNPICPAETSLRAVSALQPFERFLCFGNRDLTFEPVAARDQSLGRKTSKRWISSDGKPDFFTGLPVYGLTPELAMPDDGWFRVTGHFDDASSIDCGEPSEVAWCRQRFVVSAVTPVEPPETVLRGTWRLMRPPPIDGRAEHAMVWTGSEVVIWGGTSSSREQSVFEGAQPRDGAAYDPATDRWHRIPNAPIAGRNSPITVWTGSEVVVFGGVSGETWLLDGAAWNPTTKRWRALASSPLTGSEPVGAWLGGRLVVVTSTATAAYAPAADSWIELPTAPIRPGWRTATVAGDRLFVVAFGDGAMPPVDWAVLDLEAGSWATGTVPWDAQMAGSWFVGAGDHVVVPVTGLMFDPRTHEWSTKAGCTSAAQNPQWTGRYLLTVTWAWDSNGGGRCLDLPPSPPREPPFDDTNGRGGPGVWTGREYITWSGYTAGDTVWVPKDGAVFIPERDLTAGATP